MSDFRERVARAVPAAIRSAGVHCRAACGALIALLSAVSGCSDDSQPDPPDMAGAGDGSACPSDLPRNTACASRVPSYEREVAPIVEQRCATCHYPGNTQSEDVFADYDDVYSIRQTVLTRVYSCAMPPDGAPPLTPDERRALLRWFVCGAPEN